MAVLNGTTRTKTRRLLMRRDGWNCHYCDEVMTSLLGIAVGEQPVDSDATIEHIVPISYGGPSILWNLILVCRYCNHARGNEREWCICASCAEAWRRFAIDYIRTVKQSRKAALAIGWRWSVLEDKWVPDT